MQRNICHPIINLRPDSEVIPRHLTYRCSFRTTPPLSWEVCLIVLHDAGIRKSFAIHSIWITKCRGKLKLLMEHKYKNHVVYFSYIFPVSSTREPYKTAMNPTKTRSGINGNPFDTGPPFFLDITESK